MQPWSSVSGVPLSASPRFSAVKPICRDFVLQSTTVLHYPGIMRGPTLATVIVCRLAKDRSIEGPRTRIDRVLFCPVPAVIPVFSFAYAQRKHFDASTIEIGVDSIFRLSASNSILVRYP